MNIKVCIGESCHLQGAEEIVKTFKEKIGSFEASANGETVNLKGCFCMNNCKKNHVSVLVDTAKHAVKINDADTFVNTQIKPKE